MFDTRTFEEIKREIEQARRDYSRAENTIETTKKQLADFVLVNAELITNGEKLDLSAYEETIRSSTWDKEFAERTFNENKARLQAMVERLTISY